MEVDPVPAHALGGLTSTTAPGKTFATRSDLAAHYKSDWHRYNLKRREAGLPMLRETDFQARLEAALALRKEREQREERSGTGHLKGGKSGKSKKKDKKKDKNDQQKQGGKKERREAKHAARAVAVEVEDASDDEKDNSSSSDAEQAEPVNDGNKMDGDQPESPTTAGGGEDPTPAIDPCQSLFDNTLHRSPEASLSYMSRKYGFFLPDLEYCIDLEGLLGYCQEKVKLGHYCLYCQRIYKTWSGCQKHMVDASHCKLKYERGVDQEEFDVFYDFSEANADFLGKEGKGDEEESDVVYEEDMDDEEDGEWEDISDDEMGDNDDDDDMDGAEDDYQEYEAELKTHGFDITPLGELIFPDGRIIGHRGLSRYYKQRFAPDGERAAVTAARRAAGERVYAGRVHQIGGPPAAGGGIGDGSRETTLALAKAGLVAGAAAGRSGRGILVPASGTSGPSGGAGAGAGSFTALSLYRYKAAVKKSRREEAKGHRLQQRTKMNINRMDKKANRLMNGVSVAHAAR